jgi:hypothetical protein
LRSRDIRIEIEWPTAPGQSMPDLRALAEGGPIEIEVARPVSSEAQESAQLLLQRLAPAVYAARADTVLVEVLVSWPAGATEEATILSAASGEIAAVPGAHIELPGIGGLWVSEAPSEEENTRLFHSA